MQSKTCSICKSIKPTTEFYIDKRNKDGRRSSCSQCTLEDNRKHRQGAKRSPKRVATMKATSKRNRVKNRYAITVEEYDNAMLTSPICEICSTSKELCYDHDHTSMKFRGVLCRGCNKAIGQLGDTLESLQKAVTYLTKDRKE